MRAVAGACLTGTIGAFVSGADWTSPGKKNMRGETPCVVLIPLQPAQQTVITAPSAKYLIVEPTRTTPNHNNDSRNRNIYFL